jgi:hypothetical protein
MSQSDQHGHIEHTQASVDLQMNPQRLGERMVAIIAPCDP